MASRIRRKAAPSFDKRWLWGIAAVAAVGVVSWAIVEGGGGNRAPELSAVGTITSIEGYETQPSLSPDGKRVAFAGYGAEPGPADIFVRLVDGGEPLQLTRGPADDHSPTWSHDGTKVAFYRQQPEGGCGVMEVPALGGPERRLAVVATGPTGGCPYSSLDYSPDGRFLAMADGRGLTLLSLERGDRIELTSPPDPENDRGPAFSPDGRKVAFLRDSDRVPGGEVRVQAVDGGEQEVVAFDKFVNQLAWAPSGRALVCAVVEGGLWWVPLSDDDPMPLEVGGQALHVSVAPGAEPVPRMVFTERGRTNSNIYRLSGPAAGEKQYPVKLIASTRPDITPDISPDGTKIAFTSSRAGPNGIWVCGIGDDKSCIELSEGLTPRWSPDGRKIAFQWRSAIFVVDADGGIPVRITPEDVDVGAPSWSSDGSSIYLSDLETGIWRMPAEGGEAIRITNGPGGPSRESPDGRFLYFWRPGGIWRIPTVGGEETPVVENENLRYFDWTLWEDNLIYALRRSEEGTTIHQLNLESGEEREMARLDAPRGTGLAVSPDGQWLYVSQQEPLAGDLILVDWGSGVKE